MTERSRTVVNYTGLTLLGALLPLGIAFAHDVRGEVKALRSEVIEELRLTRSTITHGLAGAQMRISELEGRVAVLETKVELSGGRR